MQSPSEVAEEIATVLETDSGERFTRADDARLETLAHATGRDLPPVWQALLGRASNIYAAGVITSSGHGPFLFEDLTHLIQLQGETSTAASRSASPYAEVSPVYLGDLHQMPLLAVGAAADPPVVLAPWASTTGPISEPYLVAESLTSWLTRLHVPPAVREMVQSIGRRPVLTVEGSAPAHAVAEYVSQLMEILPVKSADRVVIEDGPPASSDGRSLRVRKGWYRDVLVQSAGTEHEVSNAQLLGRDLQHVNAALAAILLVVATSLAGSGQVYDHFGLLGDPDTNDLSPAQARQSLLRLVDAGSFDGTLHELRSRIAVCARFAGFDNP